MADPVSATLTAVGTVIGVIGQLDNMSAKLGELQGARKSAIENKYAARRQTGFALRQLRQQGAQLLGRQKALMAKSGAMLGEGSPLALQLETVGELEKDAWAIKAHGEAAEKQTDLQLATLKEGTGQVLSAGALNIGSTLLTGIAQTARYAGPGFKPYAQKKDTPILPHQKYYGW